MNKSRDQSPADSNSESSATSPGESSGAKRRTRASKPKVRTGCITCKIRRVKCDEGKPACQRCTITGRVCDGYDTRSPSRVLSAARVEESQRNMELARQEFLRAYQWSAGLRSLRPIAADIEGSEPERRFFHAFRSAFSPSAAAAADHPSRQPSPLLAGGHAPHQQECQYFWSRLAPRLAHREGAVKHALVALGAAHQLYQQSPDGNWCHGVEIGGGPAGSGGGGGAGASAGESNGELELFTIQQYNKSIALLAKHASSSSPESVQVTLVCCLVFICLEMLRSNHAATLTHLTNGLRILESLAPEAFDFLAADTGGSSSTPPSRNPSPSPPSPQPQQQQQQPPLPPPIQRHHETSGDMREIIRIFCRLECSAALFASGVQPSLALRAYSRRRLDDGSLAFPTGRDSFESLSEAHAHISSHLRDVIAHMSETGGRWASADFWSDPYQTEQQAALYRRSHRLGVMLDRFAAGPAAPAPETPEYLSLHMSLLQAVAAKVFVHGMTGSDSEGDVDDLGRMFMWGTSLDGAFDLNASLQGEMWGLDPTLMSGRFVGGDNAMSGGRAGSGGGLGHRSQADLARIVEVASVMVQTRHAIKQQRGGSSTGQREFTYDAGMLWPVYLAATSSQDPAVRQNALKILREATTREGLWDGPALHDLIREVGSMVSQGQWPFHKVPQSLTGLGGVPDMWQTLEMMRLRNAQD